MLKSLLHQSATVYPKSGYNKYGRDTSGAGTTVKCRFQNDSKTRLLPNQQVVVIDGVVFFDGTVSVNTEDRILIGDISYKAFKVDASLDGRGNQKIIEVEVQRWT